QRHAREDRSHHAAHVLDRRVPGTERADAGFRRRQDHRVPGEKIVSAPAMTASERIAAWLAAAGVERVFAVTGGGSMFLNHAFAFHPAMHCTHMHHEQACAMAAEGYTRISGRPAVVNVTTGPGGINALNGVFGAFTDSIPMIVISGQVKRETALAFA